MGSCIEIDCSSQDLAAARVCVDLKERDNRRNIVTFGFDASVMAAASNCISLAVNRIVPSQENGRQNTLTLLTDRQFRRVSTSTGD